MFDMPSEMKKISLVIFILLLTGLYIVAPNTSFGATVRLGSITGIDMPTRVAVDISGNIYVTEPGKNRLQIFNRNGELVYTLHGLKKPLGVAVDLSGRIYIGNDGSDNVSVYSPDRELLYKLGKGEGEFKTPNSIVISSSGMIYVSDSRDNLIKIYNPDGSHYLTFGGFGSSNGQFNVPLGLALDEIAEELYVSDLGIFTDSQNGLTSGARVQVFDLNGRFKRSFGEYGTGDGKLIRPLGIALDNSGKLYITDSYQNVAQAFDITGRWIETVYNLQNPMKTPIGIAIGKDNRIFTASLNTSTVEIYGLSNYTFLTATPESLTFSAQAGFDPDPQTINIGNTGTGSLDWSITTTAQWITADRTTGITGPSSYEAISIGIETSGLAAGTHTGIITITSPGASETISVTIKVLPPPVLEVSPLILNFKGQENGIQPSSQTATVKINNDITGRAEWKAASSAPWLSANPASGSSIPTTISVSADTAGLTAGTYSGNITITSSGASGSPALIDVILTVTSTGDINVSTNIQDAAFRITGSSGYNGSGMNWSVKDAPSGQYSITFNKVSGYRTPASQEFRVNTGRGISISAEYASLMANRKIIAVRGSLKTNPALVKILNTDGTAGGPEFTAPSLKKISSVAAGDINGDGTDEIIVASGDGSKNPARIKAFNADGTELSGADFLVSRSKYGARVASADLDGDGKTEIITVSDSNNISIVSIFSYNISSVIDTGINFISDPASDGLQMAAGDIDGDGKAEIITASRHLTIKVWKIDASAGPGNWTVTNILSFSAFAKGKGIIVTTGDLNGDGTEEIITGKTGGNIRIFKGDGNSYGTEFIITNSTGPLSIVAGDTDSDGIAEIIISTATLNNKISTEIRTYDTDGTLLDNFTPFTQSSDVKVGLGRFE